MSINFSMQVTVPKHVLVRAFENSAALLNLETEHYHGLDDVGTRMWQMLTQCDNIQAAYEGLLSEYDVAPDRLRHDLQDFLEKLLEKGLIQVVNN